MKKRATKGDDAHDGDENLGHCEARALLDDLLSAEGIVEEGPCAGDHAHDIIPGDIIDLLLPLFCGVGQKAQQDDQAHEGGQTDLLQEGGKQGHPDTEKGEPDQDGLDDQGRFSLPHAYVGLSVIFSHDLLEVFLHQLIFPFFCICAAHSVPPVSTFTPCSA